MLLKLSGVLADLKLTFLLSPVQSLPAALLPRHDAIAFSPQKTLRTADKWRDSQLQKGLNQAIRAVLREGGYGAKRTAAGLFLRR